MYKQENTYYNFSDFNSKDGNAIEGFVKKNSNIKNISGSVTLYELTKPV